ncbi:YezD family protein [Thermoanaerobacterium thermosaccharolyticum]|uniref:Uncharacterized small protein n=1 Tax=Thermoanaerobacterium thermosaccharolyticum M0795 TaxID=698948 RepID=L0IK39_THETR|nr:YezD family protein [Thermoanaerobacterium thermosaccharolyticum]AGB19218.1 uncharacterized small protein [Thermoanaerobacterium thermosaccharolyticum M0795]
MIVQTPKDKKNRNNDHNFEINRIKDLLNEIKYGEIRLVVQDGILIQIEKSEKFRFKDAKDIIV